MKEATPNHPLDFQDLSATNGEGDFSPFRDELEMGILGLCLKATPHTSPPQKYDVFLRFVEGIWRWCVCFFSLHAESQLVTTIWGIYFFDFFQAPNKQNLSF